MIPVSAISVGSVESFSTGADAVARLLSAVAWPATVGFVVLIFFPVLRKRLENSDVTVKGAGFELMLRQSRAAANLGAAVQRSGSGNPSEVASAVAEAGLVDPARLASATVLWVDDHPENNEYERSSLLALGIKVVSVRTNAEAERELKAARFPVVITDLGRNIEGEQDPDAGYKTVALVREAGGDAECIVYAGRRVENETERRRLREAGASVATDRPAELLSAVVGAIASTH